MLNRNEGFIKAAFRLAIAGALLGGGCGDDKTTKAPSDASPFFPEDFEQTYTMVRDCRISQAHSNSITVWVDPGSAQDYLDGTYPFEDGTVIVKILHSDDDCGTVRQYDVMKKGSPGTAPGSGDWIWQEVRADRSVFSEGVNQSCISCHVGCTAGRDLTCTDP